jgi:CRISPR-associated protein Cmr1
MTTNSLTIKLTTLTPLWTGGADGRSDSGLHITGIMGSLRWWYEVLVRGIGGQVCSMSSPCIYDAKQEPYHSLCDVCRLFGATGWARRFKLIVSEENLQPKKPSASTIDRSGRRVFTLSRDHPADHDPKWYLSSDPLYGDVTLEVIVTLPLEVKEKGKQLSVEEKEKQLLDPKVIGALIQLIADRGSIGAKPQMGLGLVRVVDRQNTQPLLEHLKQLVEKHEHHKDRKDYHAYDELPSLHNMFFARVKVTSATESDTFDLKYDIRGMFRQAFIKDVDLRHTIMGSVHRGDRRGAKIMMSYPYDNGIIRIWGWIPKLAGSHPSQGEILDEIYSLLEDIYRDNFSYWLDFNPSKHSDIVKYLEEHLLKEEK